MSRFLPPDAEEDDAGGNTDGMQVTILSVTPFCFLLHQACVLSLGIFFAPCQACVLSSNFFRPICVVRESVACIVGSIFVFAVNGWEFVPWQGVCPLFGVQV